MMSKSKIWRARIQPEKRERKYLKADFDDIAHIRRRCRDDIYAFQVKWICACFMFYVEAVKKSK